MIAAAVGCALGLLMLLLALRAGRKRRLIDNIPTSKTTGVFIGFVELNGTAEVELPLVSNLAVVQCVHYHWTVEEHWSRTVTEHYTDSKGNSQTRTRHESGWTTVASGGESMPFYLKDDCGIILVQPQGAKIEPAEVFRHTCGRDDPLYYGKGPSGSIMNTDYERQFIEKALVLHVPLYVIGQARERQDLVAPEIAQDKQAPMFLISTRTERQISRGLNAQYWVLGILAIIFAIIGWIVRDQMLHVRPETDIPKYLLVAGGAIFAWMLGWVWMAYNSMMDLNQRVRQGWSNVDVQLKRRAELIPNLVSIVQGLRDYERTTQTELALLRSQAEATQPGVSGPDPQGCAKAIVAIAERYPELTTNKSFLDLQRQLAETEQRIALARGYFNSIAAFYNIRLEVVPDKFICSLGGLHPQQFIAAEDFERAAVKVNLAGR